MQRFTVHAATAYSARAIAAALSQFDSEWAPVDDHYEVMVRLAGGDREVVDVLNALELYVAERKNGPAHIDFAGREYTLNAAR
jgi:hypothetical protein